VQFQEVLTNFPLGNQIVSGLFLDVTLVSPEINGAQVRREFNKSIFDRIGFPARQAGSFSVNIAPDIAPAIRGTDIWTLAISPIGASFSAVSQLRAASQNVAGQLQSELPQPRCFLLQD
jgi:hypothetical protein